MTDHKALKRTDPLESSENEQPTQEDREPDTPPSSSFHPVADAGHLDSEKDAATAAKRTSKAKKPAVETIEALLKQVFETKPDVPFRFASDKLKILPVEQSEFGYQADVITTLAKQDLALTGSLKLLQYIALLGQPLGRRSGEPLETVLERLRDLALEALSQHPVFQGWKDQLRDPLRSPELTFEVLIEAIDKLDVEIPQQTEQQLSESDKNRLRRNALACLSLVRVLQGAWALDRFIDETQSAIWEPEVPKDVSAEKAAGLLSSSKAPGLIGLVTKTYVARVRNREEQIQRLEQALAIKVRVIDDLESQRREDSIREEELKVRLEDFAADIVRLRKELDAERDNRVVDRSHAADDYETLRTRVIRRLTDEVNLLTDALHALRNGATPVAEEFLDRSLLALSREVEQLKDATGGL